MGHIVPKPYTCTCTSCTHNAHNDAHGNRWEEREKGYDSSEHIHYIIAIK